ncbi:MAG: hypothetical protein ACTSRZ_14160 [Promethearchaeota archaeon]
MTVTEKKAAKKKNRNQSAKQTKLPNIDKTNEGEIKEASIAKFMRKRTQLVGFDYGLYKHSQYAVEFVDNALDAVEKYQWDQKKIIEQIQDEIDRVNSKIEIFQENVNYLNQLIAEDKKNNQLTKKLRQLVKNLGVITQKLDQIDEIYENNKAKLFSISHYKKFSSYMSELESLSIKSSNLDEAYKIFNKVYKKILRKYSNLANEIENINKDPKFKYTLDKEIFLENLTYINYKRESNLNPEVIQDLKSLIEDDESNLNENVEADNKTDLLEENKGVQEVLEDKNNFEDSEEVSISPELSDLKKQIAEEEKIDDEEARELRKKKKKQEELEKEVQNLIISLEKFIEPVLEIVNEEPIVIIKLKEEKAPEVYKEKGDTDTYLYTFEIFDNGTGMPPNDLLKFGKYLASSKSQKLRQTRGSQGFGAPSAFSDAQNTTGRPVTVVSKHFTQPFGIASQFYTTEKNTKVYVIEPVEIPCEFYHGTYCKLQYLNKKYIRGYVDTYIDRTALMNTHVTLIFIDPYGDEHIFPRRVNFFPKEPKYALPHPSSIKIGDFQDLLRSSKNLTVSAFLTENFVRMSSSLAKKIIQEAELGLEEKFKFVNLREGFLSIIKKINQDLILVREEQRIFGKSKKPRPKLIVYLINDVNLKEQLWEKIKAYDFALNQRKKYESEMEELNKKIEDLASNLNKSSNKKEDKHKINALKKEIVKLEKNIESEQNYMLNAKKALNSILKGKQFTNEITDPKIIDKYLDIIKEISLSKAKPSQLTRIQTEYLYMAFKNQKYMAPPTDTAIPVGETALETALIKKYKLNISDRLYYFGTSDDKLLNLNKGDPIELNYKKQRTKKIMASFIEISSENNGNDLLGKISQLNINIKPSEYESFIDDLDLNRNYGDDFVAAETRKPTSGKGLAFVVEAAMAYSPKNIPTAKKASQVVSRYVNRTPKLRDNSSCALWIGIQNVNWKNYKVQDTFDNGIPKGNYIILINCSGPYTHLMFKSQSKNALAEDEILLKEIKQCMEAIGRRLRKYLSKKERREQRQKRSKLIEKNIPLFVSSLYKITRNIPKLKLIKEKDLMEAILNALKQDTEEKAASTPIKIPERLQKSIEKEKQIKETTAQESSKDEIIAKDLKKEENIPKIKPIKPQSPKESKKEMKGQAALITYEITSENILKILSDGKWHRLESLKNKMNIQDERELKFLVLILKKLLAQKKIKMGKTKEGTRVWKIRSDE